jgi:hypothetical protein
MSAQNKRSKNGSGGKAIQKSHSAAPGQALGFYLQETVLTHRLLSAQPGDYLSLELMEDVAVHKSTGTLEFIQSTSTAGNNPIADRDPKVWKTLLNWIVTIRELQLDPARVRFVLYVSSPVSGSLVNVLASATTPIAAQAALHAARNELWGPAPTFPKRTALPQSLSKFVNPLLSAEDEIIVPLISNFELQCGSGSPHEDFLAALQQQIVLEDVDIQAVAPQMLGWVKQKIELSLEKQQPAIVSRDEFFVQMRAYIRATAFRQILRSFAAAPSDEEKDKERLKTYVRQLELIELDQTQILRAITDYLMSSSERVQWALHGLVNPPSFDAFDAEVLETWSNHNLVAEACFPPDKPIPRGRSLYGNCMTHQLHIQGIPAPNYFLRGCFHKLADIKTLGWHPEFKKLLMDKKK